MSHAAAQRPSRSDRHRSLSGMPRRVRARLYPHAETRRILAASGLPAPVLERIDTIVRLTRLWSEERAEIARELVAHAGDALDRASCRAPEDAAADLGEPGEIARLLRRSVRRKRPWLWRAQRRAMQACACTLCVLMIAYAVLFARFNLASPRIDTNYFALLNRHNEGFTADQYALPALEALWIAYRREEIRTEPARDERYRAYLGSARHTDPPPSADRWAIERLHETGPADLGYEEFIGWLRSIRPLLDDAQAAAALPTLGALYSNNHETIDIDRGRIRLSRPRPYSMDRANLEPMNGPMFFWVDDTFVSAKLLAADASLACREQDAARALDRLTAVFRLAALCSREPFAKSRIVGSAVQAAGERTLLGIMETQPGFFSDETLAALCHAIASNREQLGRVDLAAEQMRFDDLMQHAFTDDGSGDGRLTPAGVREIVSRAYFDDFGYAHDLPISPRSNARVVGPLYDLAVASRAEHRAVYLTLTSLVKDAINGEPQSLERFGPEGAYTLLYARRVQSSMRFPAIELLLTDLHRLPGMMLTAETSTDAALLVLAAHLHRRQTGSWPSSAEELVPALLPAAPMDPFDPGRPLRLLIDDDRLVVYSVGTDGDDDHAAPCTAPGDGPQRDLIRRYTPADDLPSDTAPAPDGDWILYPLPG